MILGVYWYYDFPDGLHTYEYFKFSKGYGGHADNPAELVADVEVANPTLVIEELRTLVDLHPDAFMFIYTFENVLRIGTGGYAMHDFEFELIHKVEDILKRHTAQTTIFHLVNVAELIKFSNIEPIKKMYPTKKYFTLAASSPHKYNSEYLSIRFDCNVDHKTKDVFLKEVALRITPAEIDVVFYSEKEFEGRYNLMLFFTNGRQGVGLKLKQRVDVEMFEDTMDELIQKYDVQIGHVGGWDYYPIGEKIVLKIVDAEFILE